VTARFAFSKTYILIFLSKHEKSPAADGKTEAQIAAAEPLLPTPIFVQSCRMLSDRRKDLFLLIIRFFVCFVNIKRQTAGLYFLVFSGKKPPGRAAFSAGFQYCSLCTFA
jgi:hypothetical protein